MEFIKEFQEIMNKTSEQLLNKPVRRHSRQKDKPELRMEQGKCKETICKEAEMLPPRDVCRESDDKQNSIVLLEMMDTDKCIQRLIRTELEGSEHAQQKIENTIQYWVTKEKEAAMNYCCCQGTTCFLLQKHLGVLPTPTSDTFSILWTLTASKFQRHFRVLPILSPFQQSPMLLHAPSTPTPHLTSLPMAAPRPPPPPKVTQRPLQILHPPIRSLVRRSLETL